MNPVKVGHIVKFHTPMPDEDPDQLHVVLEVTDETDDARAKIKALGTGLNHPPVTTVPVSDLVRAEVDASDLLEYRVIIETVNGRRIAGIAKKVWNDKVKAELTRLENGVDSNVYLTIEDDSGNTHEGFLFVKPT